MPTILCAVCGRPIKDDEPAQRDLDGELAHLSCLEAVEKPVKDEDEDRS